MNDVRYRQPDEADRDKLLALSRRAVGMTDVYTYVSLHPELPQNARLWLGEKNGLLTVLYDDGSYYTRNDLPEGTFAAVRSVKGVSLFEKPKKKHRLVLMEYGGGHTAASGKTEPLAGKDIFDTLKLMSGSEKLPDYLEKRYVDIVRGINAELCDYVGVYENDRLVACGGIVASNEKYALLGNIFTKEEYRGKGFASDIVNALIDRALAKDLVPILYCEKEMTRYYLRFGFRKNNRK